MVGAGDLKQSPLGRIELLVLGAVDPPEQVLQFVLQLSATRFGDLES